MKRISRTQWYGVLFAAFCLTACQVKRPPGILKDAQLEDVLYDYHIAKAMGEEVSYNESYKRVLYIESVFKKHGITQADFDSSMVWFSRNPEILVKIYEKINLRLKAERNSINHLIAMRDNKPKESLPGDSIDVWVWQQIYRLAETPLDNKMMFVLPADTNFYDRDTLRWNVCFRFQNHLPTELPDSLYAPFMVMQVLYEKNDSIVSSVQRVMKEGVKTISLHADTLGKIKEIRGFIYYPAQKERRALLADRISLMRHHAKDSMAVAPKDSLLQMGDAMHEDSVKQPITEMKPLDEKEGDAREMPEHRDIRPRPTLQEVEKVSR